ncbi:hypothetical protein BpHYR1_001449 [Brachionus plicatilis]|uniref:Uncharacterized protein n=1 Tax=Brachionus plicatilis TaxID=10195 RepID=A0A3M7T476_BRAPC|nr:hypothetical protein BpHYR1_001449 [Brachionus plicatilis]
MVLPKVRLKLVLKNLSANSNFLFKIKFSKFTEIKLNYFLVEMSYFFKDLGIRFLSDHALKLYPKTLSLSNYQLRFLARDIDELNENITQKILNAANKSVPFQSQKIFKSSLPKNINEEKLGEISKKLAAKY